MTKPVFRWTVGGNVSQPGLDVLRESVKKTQQVLGADAFRWYVCCNQMNAERVATLRSLNAEVIEQQWTNLPLPLPENHNLDNEVRNAIWKVCPPRLDIDTHEIIVDNDLVLCNRFKELNQFLKSDRILLLEDPLRFYGKYNNHVAHGLDINTGFIGLPPGYDFATDISNQWHTTGNQQIAGLDDEQGLLVLAASKSNRDLIIIPKSTIVELHPDGIWHSWADAGKGRKYRFTGKEGGLHFVEINRKPFHEPWQQYKQSGVYKILHG